MAAVPVATRSHDRLVDSADAATPALRLTPAASRVAYLGVCLLIIAAPFETLNPIVRLPGQSLSSVEAVLIAVIAGWTGASIRTRAWPEWRTALTWPWVATGLAAFLAAVASANRTNALHMVGRLALAFSVYLATVNGVTSAGRLRRVLIFVAGTGAIVALLALLEVMNVAPVIEWLRHFRVNTSRVGAQIRAGGPFQYPTIASMYLEIVFAMSLGLLMFALDAGRRALAAATAVVLLAVAQAIAMTFTRAGLITMASSLLLVSVLRIRRHGVDRVVGALVGLSLVVILQVVTSRSVESLRLRLTTEGQNTWYRAEIDAPPRVSLPAGGTIAVPLTVTNIGDSSWDPHAPNRFRLSYHWLTPDGNRVVSWEGLRTDFANVVRPGDRVTLGALVEAPRQTGEFRLMWDLEQEDRQWFSTEPDARRSVTFATVSGPPVASGESAAQTFELPARAVRPGRFVLWRAAGLMLAEHPLVGVGPDNFRLQYGKYAGLPDSDARVHTNNMYLEVLVGGGLLTGIAFFWLLWAASRQIVALLGVRAAAFPATLTSGIVAAAAAIALHGLVDSFLGFTGTYILTAITLGLVAASVRMAGF
jgi:hypothetical protein